MPYAITALDVQPAAAVYTLGKSESFTPLAISCVFAYLHLGFSYGYPTIEYRDAAGGLIYHQTLNSLLKGYNAMSAAAGPEPYYVSNNGPFGFPQDKEQQVNSNQTIRLPLITLAPGCSVGIYVMAFTPSSNNLPTDILNTDWLVQEPHLWVEDARLSRRTPAPLPPLLAHVA